MIRKQIYVFSEKNKIHILSSCLSLKIHLVSLCNHLKVVFKTFPTSQQKNIIKEKCKHEWMLIALSLEGLTGHSFCFC